MCMHKWSKWQPDFKTDMVNKNGIVIGWIFVQKRICEKCGLEKRKKQVIK